MSVESKSFHLLLGVCGSAQSEYTPQTVERILKTFDTVNLQLVVIATPSSIKFFDVGRVQKMLPERFFVEHWDHSGEFHVPHIQLAEWADLICVYPTTSNTLAKAAYGITDTLLLNTILASRAPIYFGPTMNDSMYFSKPFQANLKRIKSFGFKLIPKEKTKVFIHSEQKEVIKDFCSEKMLMKTILEEIKRKRKKSK
jgi:phosphopantothenoylcysteine decarboxylase/phosphopantothenate--cysteine ligase